MSESISVPIPNDPVVGVDNNIIDCLKIASTISNMNMDKYVKTYSEEDDLLATETPLNFNPKIGNFLPKISEMSDNILKAAKPLIYDIFDKYIPFLTPETISSLWSDFIQKSSWIEIDAFEFHLYDRRIPGKFFEDNFNTFNLFTVPCYRYDEFSDNFKRKMLNTFKEYFRYMNMGYVIERYKLHYLSNSLKSIIGYYKNNKEELDKLSTGDREFLDNAQQFDPYRYEVNDVKEEVLDYVKVFNNSTSNNRDQWKFLMFIYDLYGISEFELALCNIKHLQFERLVLSNMYEKLTDEFVHSHKQEIRQALSNILTSPISVVDNIIIQLEGSVNTNCRSNLDKFIDKRVDYVMSTLR